MLKYVMVIVGIISFCDSYPTRLMDELYKLVLVQRSPAAVIFELEHMWGKSGVAANNKAIKDLRAIGAPYEARKWVIEALWCARYYTPKTFCRDSLGLPITYQYLESDFRSELAKVWPNFDETRTDIRLWTDSYNTYGSCVNASTLGYFQRAMQLLRDYNIGEILTRSGIHPGRTYRLSRIHQSITNALNVRSYVICRPHEDPDTDEQYLLEVHICFNREIELINCNTYATGHCDHLKSVIYPGSPTP